MPDIVRISVAENTPAERHDLSVVMIAVPVLSILEARDALEKLEVTAALCQRVLDKVEQYGELDVLHAVREALRATAETLV